ncbi:TrkA C-terminal domain-containing protein [Nitrosococcus watsonii]|uniref:TrkA C-terminal domain-containing protein n=1 Tax=Nitrosococcus watsonii TaxID=473531 RepID=UPI0002F9FAE4|nr:TrkA C-terminal domain-containing protein [Nitrosococcus watsonii]
MGRSLGFRRVVTKIEDPELEHLCIELGLDDTIIPDRTIGRYLADRFDGRNPLELSTMIRDVARVFSFAVGEEDEGAIEALDLPEKSRVICVYRNNEFLIPDAETQLKAKDEVVIIMHRQNLAKLEERWTPQRRQSIS